MMAGDDRDSEDDGSRTLDAGVWIQSAFGRFIPYPDSLSQRRMTSAIDS
jgi:hypothetical protein